jgi:hypothetical protein
MTAFELGRRFDVVTCLFSSIGYVRTVARLRSAIATMARHLEPGGALVVEPWLLPSQFRPGLLSALFVDEPELKGARLNSSRLRGKLSVIDFHYLVGTPQRIEEFTEHHELRLFSHEEYLDAFSRASLHVEHIPEGLTNRGLYVGVR